MEGIEGGYFVELHEFFGVHDFLLVEGCEQNLLRLERLVGEGALDGVEVVSAHRHESAVAAEVLVELVLERDEGLVAFGGESDTAEDTAGDVGSDFGGLKPVVSSTVHPLSRNPYLLRNRDLMGNTIRRVHNGVIGRLGLPGKDVQHQSDSLEAEHIISGHIS